MTIMEEKEWWRKNGINEKIKGKIKTNDSLSVHEN